MLTLKALISHVMQKLFWQFQVQFDDVRDLLYAIYPGEWKCPCSYTVRPQHVLWQFELKLVLIFKDLWTLVYMFVVLETEP